MNKLDKAGLAPIYLRITVDGVRTETSTKIYIAPNNWDKVKSCSKGKSIQSQQINKAITDLELRIRSIYNDLISRNELVSSIKIKNILIGIDEKRYSLITFFSNYCDELFQLAGIELRLETAKYYVNTKNYLIEFLNHQYKVNDLFLKDVDIQFISAFDFWLKTIKKNSNNSALKHHSRLKTVLSKAVSIDLIAKTPYSHFKLKKTRTNREFLTEEELQAIENKTFSFSRIERVKDAFLFTCYTGLSFIDLKELKQDDIRIGIDGNLWIFTHRRKTDVASHIPLLPKALAIIEKYRDDPETVTKGTLLPVASNQKMNAYLKEIADLCGIKKNLTCHMGRHTFATTVTLNNNVSIEAVSKMLGHTDIKTTQIYAKILDKKVSHEMMPLLKKVN